MTAKSPKLLELDENFGAVDPMGSDEGKVIFTEKLFNARRGLIELKIFKKHNRTMIVKMRQLTYMMG